MPRAATEDFAGLRGAGAIPEGGVVDGTGEMMTGVLTLLEYKTANYKQ